MVNELQPDEVDLVGRWQAVGDRVEADFICARISWLIAERLVLVTRDSSGWLTLYRDPSDGRLWEHSYPQGDMHGGGPPRLAVITPDAAGERYTLGTT